MKRLILLLLFILASVIYAQISFNAGELSPFLLRRMEFEKYDNGLQQLDNFTIRVEGPVCRRPGTKYVAETETMSEESRLLKFEQSKTDAYIIEAGDVYFRFYRNGGQILDANDDPYEIVTVFEEDELSDIQYVQNADTMYLVDGNDPPQQLSRADHDDWTIADMNFTTGPFLDENISTTTVEPNGLTGTITLTADANIFDADHVGALWRIGYRRTDNPLTGILSSATSSTTIEVDGSYYYNIQGTWEGDVILEKSYDAGVTYETVYPRYNDNTAINEDFDDSEADEDVIYRVTMENYVSGSANYYLRVAENTNYGIVKIATYVDANEVTATVLSTLEDANSGTTLWSEGAWSDYRGWPQTIEFYEQRLMFGGSDSYPQTIWATKTASGASDDYENMTAGPDDDDALIYVLPGQNPIQWMKAQTQLLIGTLAGVGRWGSADDENAITPTNPTNYREQARYGAAYMQAELVGDAVLYVERGGHKVREFSYSLERDRYVAPDMTVLSEHITGSGIVDIAYQGRPQPILWCVLDDGDIAALTYQRNDEVVGWSQYITQGDFESVAVVPGTDEDEVWVIVKRDINDTDVRYVEQFQPQDWGSDDNDAIFVDCALTFDGGDAVNITDITNTDPAVVTTSTTHGFEDGDQVYIKDVVGMTQINNAVYSVGDVNATAKTFELRNVTDSDGWDTSEGIASTYITLITPAEEWVSGATVQFKFSHYGLGWERQVNIPEQGGLGTYMSGIWRQLLLGSASYTEDVWQTRFLWTQAEITDFMDNASSEKVSYSYEKLGAAVVGVEFLSDPTYFDSEPDAYAEFVSATPDYQSEIAWTETAVDPDYFFRFTDVYEFREYTEDAIVIWADAYSMKVGSEAIADTGAAYFIANPPAMTAQDKALYWFDPNGNILDYADKDVDEYPGVDCVSVSFNSGGTASVLESSDSTDHVLPEHDITVTLKLTSDLPEGGLYLFAPTCYMDWYATLFPPYYPDLYTVGVEDLVYVSSYDSLLVNPDSTTIAEVYTSGGTARQVERDFTDANHLNGETVTVYTGGGVPSGGTSSGTAVVSDGAVSIDKWVNVAHLGLPYTSALKTMPIIVPEPTGPSAGKIARIDSITIDFLDSLGVKYGQDETNLNNVAFWEGRPQGLYTGIKKMPFMHGFARDNVVYLESAEPLPFAVRMILPNIVVTER